MKPTRRGLLALAASTFVPRPAAAEDDPRPCYDPEYLKWTGRREHRWPDRIGEAGFVNYYGEAFRFDAAIDVPRDRLPTCAVWGAEATTLDDPGKVKTNLHKLTVDGAPASTNCFLWPDASAADFDEKIATFLDELRAACPAPGKGDPVRFIAVGSHHSSSDVYKRPDDAKAVMVRVDGLNHILTERPEWKSDRFTVPYALVGAGVTVCQLNEALWDKGLALETQGSFDGQSLAGAISTGTHGAGAEHGAIADSVQGILVATCLRDPETGAGRWEIVQIEPDAAEAITDPERFATTRAGAPWRLVQDRRLFEAAIVAMGTMGVIVGYVMRVRSAYFLRELRVGRAWSELTPNLLERATTPANGFSANGWRYEVVVSPSPVATDIPDQACTEVYRDSWQYDLDYLEKSRVVPDKWLGGVTRNVNLGGQLGQLVTAKATAALVRGKRVGLFADRAYRVLKLGQGEYVQAWGCEFMVPAERAVDLVNWIVRSNPERGQLRRGFARGTRLLNPFGVRFARGRQGFLSPTRRYRDGRPDLTCTVELTEAIKDDDTLNLGDPRGDKPSAKGILEVWAADFLREFGSDARLHWGQVQGAYGPADLARGYPQEDIDAWYAGFRTLNPFGLFDTAWAVRVGMVARRDADRGAWPRYTGI